MTAGDSLIWNRIKTHFIVSRAVADFATQRHTYIKSESPTGITVSPTEGVVTAH